MKRLREFAESMLASSNTFVFPVNLNLEENLSGFVGDGDLEGEGDFLWKKSETAWIILFLLSLSRDRFFSVSV